MGYSIDQLKKTGTLEGNDTIPVMQGGLTKQVAAGILDNAKIITAAGSQASGIIRREMTYILKNNSSAINFTLNNAVGKKVVNNDYSDDAATATGWIVKVMNVSTRSHVVIVGSNSWDIAKNENMYFFWTGSAWTLHNARMNNLIVDGELKLPNAAAVTSLQATSKLAGLDANGKVNYTTPDAIKSALSLATTTDLTNLDTLYIPSVTDANICVLDKRGVKSWRVYGSNTPTPATYFVTSYYTAEAQRRIIQIAYLTSSSSNATPTQYMRYGISTDNINWTWGDWQKLTTESDCKYIKTTINANKTLTLTHSTDTNNMFLWRVSLQGNIGQAYASYLIQGYGAGGSSRDHIFTHFQGTAITITQTDNVITITNTNNLNGKANVVIEVLEGEAPTVTTN